MAKSANKKKKVKSYNVYHLRELILNRCVGPATIIITESEKLKKMIKNSKGLANHSSEHTCLSMGVKGEPTNLNQHHG